MKNLFHRVTHWFATSLPLRCLFLVALTLPLAVWIFTDSGHPFTDVRGNDHMLMAFGSAMFYFWVLGWLFVEKGQRLKRWFGPAFWCGCIGGSILAVFLGTKLETVARWLAPGLFEPQFGFMDFIDMLRRMAEGKQVLQAPSDPYKGIFLATLGFIFGVGFPEELSKWLGGFARRTGDLRERMGLAFIAGIGFGVAEGVVYSANFYNGREGWLAYAGRFVTLVGLHGTWSALTAWFLHRRPYSEDKWIDIRNIILYMAPTAVLHGAYDVLVTYDLNVLGYSVVLFSVALLCLADWMSREELTWGEVVAIWKRIKPSTPAHGRPRRIPPAAPSHSPRPRGGGGGRRFEIPDKDEQDPPLVS